MRRIYDAVVFRSCRFGWTERPLRAGGRNLTSRVSGSGARNRPNAATLRKLVSSQARRSVDDRVREIAVESPHPTFQKEETEFPRLTAASREVALGLKRFASLPAEPSTRQQSRRAFSQDERAWPLKATIAVRTRSLGSESACRAGPRPRRRVCPAVRPCRPPPRAPRLAPLRGQTHRGGWRRRCPRWRCRFWSWFLFRAREKHRELSVVGPREVGDALAPVAESQDRAARTNQGAHPREWTDSKDSCCFRIIVCCWIELQWSVRGEARRSASGSWWDAGTHARLPFPSARGCGLTRIRAPPARLATPLPAAQHRSSTLSFAAFLMTPPPQTSRGRTCLASDLQGLTGTAPSGARWGPAPAHACSGSRHQSSRGRCQQPGIPLYITCIPADHRPLTWPRAQPAFPRLAWTRQSPP